MCVVLCVSTPAWLHIPDISFFSFTETFFCQLLNVFRSLCPLTRVCLNPRVVTSSGHFDLRYFDTLRSHTSVLSPTPTSAHAVTVTFRDMPHKKGCHWQSAFCRYKDLPPKGNSNSTRDLGHTRVLNEPCCCLQGKGNCTRNRGQTRGPKERGCCL